MNSYFKHLTNLPVLPDKYIQEGLNANFELVQRPNLFWCPSSFEETDFFKLLQERYKKCFVKYYLTHKNSYYDWHIDMNRGTGINWVIKTNPKAATFYRDPILSALPGGGLSPRFYNLTEVDYKLHNPTLLNTKFEHSVINNYPEERIIMSLSIMNNTQFDDVVHFLSQLEIESY